jgi:ATP-dependent DNA helicase RecG
MAQNKKILAPLSLKSSLEELPHVTEQYHKRLSKLRLETVEDLLYHLPTRYDDYTHIYKVEEVERDWNGTLAGTLSDVRTARSWKKHMLVTSAVLNDSTGSIRLVWFNDRFAGNSLKDGMAIRVCGKVSADFDGLFLSNPVFERAARMPVNTARLVPIYRETAGLTSRWLRWQVYELLRKKLPVPEIVPDHIREAVKLPPRAKALEYIHFPRTPDHATLAQKYFAFEEMFVVQIQSLRVKKAWHDASAHTISADSVIDDFIAQLPFTLTDGQQHAITTIASDLAKSAPMNRLLNGDVGSGKTVVAAASAYATAHNHYQVAILAPTEVLARQHFATFQKLFAHTDHSVALLTGAYKIADDHATTRAQLLKRIASHDVDIIVGTHALLQKDVHFAKLALVIVDEQHRFGVQQRAHLQEQAAIVDDGDVRTIPHFLTMTATPIPRSLALAFFGDLDLSVLDEMPANRKSIITTVVGALERERTYEFVREELAQGYQAYVILPLVELSETETLAHVKAATEEADELQEKIFPEFRVGLLHGRMKARDKDQIMTDFKNKKIDILVSTSVVEVGVDVPNASTMIIEGAERFGLSQLHQFRGRIGRGDRQSHCFLFSSKTVGTPPERLTILAQNASGFAIAEEDLKLRGPGAFFGTRQSGLPDITMANISNVKLIELARTYAAELLEKDKDLTDYPTLRQALTKYEQNVHLE